MENQIAKLDGQILGITQGIAVMDYLLVDPDLDPTGADVARFYQNWLCRKWCALLLEVDTLTIARENHNPGPPRAKRRRGRVSVTRRAQLRRGWRA